MTYNWDWNSPWSVPVGWSLYADLLLCPICDGLPVDYFEDTAEEKGEN